MNIVGIPTAARKRVATWLGPSTFVMAAVLIALGFYLVYPVLLIIIYTFNTAFEVFVGTPEWGLDNWRLALSQPGIM